MGRAKNESEDSKKAQLVSEICNISTNPRIICCHGRHHHHHYQHRCLLSESPFIDWYLILQVDENAGVDIIRKQYLKLALQLHPDKNKHPKAEFAFKIVSEAYACLSDNARKTSFDLERKNRSCVECRNGDSFNTSNNNVKGRGTTPAASERVRSDRILQRMKEMKEMKARFIEEAAVIKNCLKANAASRVSSASRKELPIFNPTDYLHHGYPHHTSATYNKMMLEKEYLRRYNSKKCVIQA